MPTESEYQLKTPELTPDFWTGKINYYSSDPDLVSVDSNGLLTIKKQGTVTIYSLAEGSYSFTEMDVYSEFYDVTYKNSSETVHTSVYWGCRNNFINGYGGVYFAPDDEITREEMVIFLYRLAGRPAVDTSTEIKFKDADKINSKGGRKAIQWAVANNIVAGFSDGTFRPQDTCTRAQTVTFLYRLCGRPEVDLTVDTGLSDIDGLSKGVYKSIVWASSKGITKGSKGNFLPDDDCLRKHIAIFMCRYAHIYLLEEMEYPLLG